MKKHPHHKINKSESYLLKALKTRSISMVGLTICFILIILLSSFSALLYNRNFYNSEFEKNKVYEKYGKNLTLKVTENIFSFFKGKEEIGKGIDLSLGGEYEGDFFTYNEKSHLYDVKKRIKGTFFIYYLSIALVIFFFFMLYFNSFSFLRDFGAVFVVTGSIVVFLAVVLYFADFVALFDLFHKIVFTGNYIFPETSNLIGLFPLKFFGDLAYRILFFSFIKAVMFLVTGIILLLSSSSAFSKKNA